MLLTDVSQILSHHTLNMISTAWFLLLYTLIGYLTTAQCYSINRSGEAVSKRRRDFIVSSIGAASSSLLWHPSPLLHHAHAEEISYERITSTKRIAEHICKYCNSAFVSSVIESKCNFLYRGLSSDQSRAVSYSNRPAAIIIKDEPFDLLSPETYGSNEAAEYFQSLENEMTAKRLPIKPSIGHLGTTCPKEAAQWGMAASIWPLGEEGVEFAWLENGGLFWPINESDMKKKRRIVTTTTMNTGGGRKRGDVQLANALQGDAWEIMLRADDGFLAVPTEFDNEIRAYLKSVL